MKTLCAEYTEAITKHHNRFTEIGMRNNFEIARSHVLYMLKQIPNLGDIGKQNRWIGFVQGWMWSVGLRTIDEMREDIREAMNRGEKVDDPLALSEKDKEELMEKMREHQARRDQDWSTLADQVVGSERV